MPFYEDFIDAAQSDCLGAPFHRQEALVPALSPLRRDQSDQPDP